MKNKLLKSLLIIVLLALAAYRVWKFGYIIGWEGLTQFENFLFSSVFMTIILVIVTIIPFSIFLENFSFKSQIKTVIILSICVFLFDKIITLIASQTIPYINTFDGQLNFKIAAFFVLFIIMNIILHLIFQKMIVKIPLGYTIGVFLTIVGTAMFMMTFDIGFRKLFFPICLILFLIGLVSTIITQGRKTIKSDDSTNDLIDHEMIF